MPDVVPAEAVRELSPSEFFENVLKKIGCVHLSCGFNYRFGKGASGNADTLSALCKESSVGCNVTGEVKKGGKTDEIKKKFTKTPVKHLIISEIYDII